MILLFITVVVLFGIVILGPSVLCAVGWKRKADQATQSANYNAQLWAESEASRHGTEGENARLRGSLAMSDRAFIEMARIASEAIKASAINNGLPISTLTDSDDSILSADHLE